MTFQIIDDKQDCKSIFYNNEIIEKPSYDNLGATWSYHDSLISYGIEFAELYAKGQSITECCPSYLRSEWESLRKKHLAFIKTFEAAQVKATDYCFYDLVPEDFLINYFKIKTEITDYVLQNYPKPTNYEFLVDLKRLLSKISKQTLIVNNSKLTLDMHSYKARRFQEKITRTKPNIKYNLFGTITGRLTTQKKSFPILTMDKSYRKIVEPQNDFYIELDFNAAELRCLLALNAVPQPNIDIHKWHEELILSNTGLALDREEIKRKVFSWLYGPLDASLGIPQIEKYYNKRSILEKYWNGHEATNIYGRTVKADEFHALNAVIQSTTSDTFLRRAIAVDKMLEGRKSFTMGLIHDSIVIDFDRNDKDILENLIIEFGNTDLGAFKVNASLGVDFGNMKRFR